MSVIIMKWPVADWSGLVAGQAEPIAKDITRGVIQPGAKTLAENAVPFTEEVCSLSFCQN